MKYFALILLSLIPILIGIWKSEDLKQKMKLREGFLAFLEEIRFQIQMFNRDQKEIYSGFENLLLTKCGFLPDLIKETNENPLGSLSRTVEFHLADFSFSKRSEDCILSLSKHFGTQSRERQLEELDESIHFLREEMAREKDRVLNKIKTIRISGFAAGLGIFILLI